MEKKLYVGNFPYNTTNEELEQKFSEHGEVIEAIIINDRETGRSKGFGFVTMSEEDANKAKEALDDTDFGGRKLRVNEARPKEERRPGEDRRPRQDDRGGNF